jgi:hypothetical protein
MFCKYRRNGECFIRALYNGRLMGDPSGRSGARNPSSIQVDYVVRGDVVIIHNTRSANALEAAGVPRSQFNAVNKTGNPAVEARVDRQLARNPGGPFDSARMEK